MKVDRQIIEELKKSPTQMFAELADAHAELLEKKLEEVLEKHKVKLGQDGVDLNVITPPPGPGNDIQIVYELRKNNVLLDTFGFAIDLTNPLN